MEISDRKADAQRRFDEQKIQREQHLANAETCLTEMNRLQGEFRLLQQLEEDEKATANKVADTIEAVPEDEKED